LRSIAQALALVGSLACSSAPEVVAPPARHAPPCTQERLLAFDPGSRVEQRQALPPMRQRLGEQKTHLASVPCRDDESDDACRRRAEREVASAYPDARALRSESGVDREELRVRYELDGRLREETFDSVEAIQERMRALVEEGRRVTLIEGKRVPAPDAKRLALVEAVQAGLAGARETLRIRIRLAPPDEPVVALLRLQGRAAEAQVTLLMVAPQPEGAIDVELGCQRRVD
jgi:hypothetical protein